MYYHVCARSPWHHYKFDTVIRPVLPTTINWTNKRTQYFEGTSTFTANLLVRKVTLMFLVIAILLLTQLVVSYYILCLEQVIRFLPNSNVISLMRLGVHLSCSKKR